jgi:hypothetical protein
MVNESVQGLQAQIAPDEVRVYYVESELGKSPAGRADFPAKILELPSDHIEAMVHQFSKRRSDEMFARLVEEPRMWFLDTLPLSWLFIGPVSPEVDAVAAPYSSVLADLVGLWLADLGPESDAMRKEFKPYDGPPGFETLIVRPYLGGFQILDGLHRAFGLGINGATELSCYVGVMPGAQRK